MVWGFVVLNESSMGVRLALMFGGRDKDGRVTFRELLVELGFKGRAFLSDLSATMIE